MSMSTPTSTPLRVPESADRGHLDRLFSPRSIVVIGASADRAKRGYQAIRSLRESQYPHPVYAVNPRGGTILGVPVHESTSTLPHGIDVALIALPAARVAAALRECAAVGVAGAVVLANGFRETGAEGVELERELMAVAEETGIRVVGPNTSGMVNVHTGANLVGIAGVPPGPISVVTQSGNMLLSLVADNDTLRGPGFHVYVGLGNQADLRYDECVSHLAGLDGTTVIAVHSEGMREGRAFLAAVAAAAPHCPVVMLRGGRSEIGRRAALSHTGSIAGSDEVATAVLAQAGVELVERSDELHVVASVLATTAPVPAGRDVVILSDGGGHATLAADALSRAGVRLAELSESTRTKLSTVLGDRAAVGNPVDVAGASDTDPMVFAACTDILMQDPAVGLVLICGLFGGYQLRFGGHLRDAEHTTALELLNIAEEHGVPLLVQSCYAGQNPSSHAILRSGNVQVLASIDHAVRAVTALHNRGRRLATTHERTTLAAPAREVADGPRVLVSEPRARQLAEVAGLNVGDWTFAATPAEAVEAVTGFGRPCALKVVSPQVAHKSDVGGVRLNVTEDTAADAWAAIAASVTSEVPGAEITGMVVAAMAEPGVELHVGAVVDPIYGPVVAFGAGGVLVEALRDVTFRAAPLTRLEAREMIEETVASRMVGGYRHLPPVDRDQLAEFLVRVGQFAAGTPGLVELDLNPVIATAGRIQPVDVRIVCAATAEREAR